jgi:hypothetical protein
MSSRHEHRHFGLSMESPWGKLYQYHSPLPPLGHRWHPWFGLMPITRCLKLSYGAARKKSRLYQYLLTRLPPLTERVREISLSWMGWGSGHERFWTLTWQEETNNSGWRLTRNPRKRGIYTKKAETLVSAFCVYQIGSVSNQF